MGPASASGTTSPTPKYFSVDSSNLRGNRAEFNTFYSTRRFNVPTDLKMEQKKISSENRYKNLLFTLTLIFIGKSNKRSSSVCVTFETLKIAPKTGRSCLAAWNARNVRRVIIGPFIKRSQGIFLEIESDRSLLCSYACESSHRTHLYSFILFIDNRDYPTSLLLFVFEQDAFECFFFL